MNDGTPSSVRFADNKGSFQGLRIGTKAYLSREDGTVPGSLQYMIRLVRWRILLTALHLQD